MALARPVRLANTTKYSVLELSVRPIGQQEALAPRPLRLASEEFNGLHRVHSGIEQPGHPASAARTTLT